MDSKLCNPAPACLSHVSPPHSLPCLYISALLNSLEFHRLTLKCHASAPTSPLWIEYPAHFLQLTILWGILCLQKAFFGFFLLPTSGPPMCAPNTVFSTSYCAYCHILLIPCIICLSLWSWTFSRVVPFFSESLVLSTVLGTWQVLRNVPLLFFASVIPEKETERPLINIFPRELKSKNSGLRHLI